MARNRKTGAPSDSFDARYGREALYRRYARARRRQFLLRQVALLIAAGVVWFAVSPGAALLCTLLVLLGELVDLVMLRQSRRWMGRGLPFVWVWRLTTLSAAVQASSIAACVMIILTRAPSEEAALIALCFLMAASVNAGFILTHHTAAAKARLGIYALCALSFLFYEGLRHGPEMRIVIHSLEVLILGYMTWTFVAFNLRSWNRRLAKEGELTHAAATLNASNRELTEANRKAEAAARAKSAFLANMSHEIRTPLNAVIGAADLLGGRDLDEEGQEYVDTIRQASLALLTVINDVLDLSRLDADRMMLAQEPFSPDLCIDEVLRVLRPLARTKGLALVVFAGEDVPPRLLGDQGRLRQILLNLVGNAIKFTDQGSVVITSGLSEGLLCIDVRDSGIGVPPDRASAIFDTFEQADAATTRRYGGTGLGLPIARALAQRMGGDVVLMPPEPQGGAWFRLTLDLPMAESPPPPQAPSPRPDLALAGPMRLVLAEDNATNRMIVRRFLRGLPVDLIEAENGRAAVEAVAWYRPHVVLMDMAMPELDGLGATRAIRLLDSAQPHIIALTANAFASDRAACAEAGMDDFLPKPLRRADLLAALVRAEGREKTLFPSGKDGVSRPQQDEGDATWTSPRESGTTNGRSTRSSGL